MIEFAIAEFARATFCEFVVEPKCRNALSHAVRAIAGLAEQSYGQMERATSSRQRIACKAGCSHCCYMRVVATVPEVIALADFVALNFSKAQFAAMRKRVMNVKTRGLTDEQWGVAHHACPLLVDGECSAYAARPLECRGYNSTDVRACRAAAKDYLEWEVPMDAALMSTFKSAQAGLLQALTHFGHSPRLVELTAALRVIFRDECAIDRWLAGENPFAEAEIDLWDPEQRAFLPWVPSDELRTEAGSEKPR